ncbi:hypothetical protein CO046_01645 [Candidatus Peregrinibacteria bacterium CG_4_9_14_0_2_um_filter_53_11]|nr:MAG: hypothetical protein CO046_01645 [Candidatus Peregrinibacteria bacterium CG_4_9_14_0_2_um_filter_53_11]
MTGPENALSIINISGLMMSGKEDGLDAALRTHLKGAEIHTVGPTPRSSFRRDPQAAVELAMAAIRERFSHTSGQPPRQQILVGRSYGGVIALQAYMQDRGEHSIDRVFCIEAPVNPSVEVRPPRLLPPLRLFKRYYDERPKSIGEALASGNGRVAGVVTIGHATDAIVPPTAMSLPKSHNIEITKRADTETLRTGLNGEAKRSLHVELSGELDTPNHTGLITSTLPEAYNRHLFWTPEKYEAICAIIAELARR